MIKAKNVRLIGSDGTQFGIVAIADALAKAAEEKLDLVVVSEGEEPVCRLMDFHKRAFEKQKNKKQGGAKKHVQQLKILKLTARIDVGDQEVKQRNLRSHLKKGDRVKIQVTFKGRELASDAIKKSGYTLIQTIIEGAEYEVVQEPKFEGRALSMIIGPGKLNKQKMRSKDNAKAENT